MFVHNAADSNSLAAPITPLPSRAPLTPLTPPTAVGEPGRVFCVPRPGLLRHSPVAARGAHGVCAGAHLAQPHAHRRHRLRAQKLHRTGERRGERWAAGGVETLLTWRWGGAECLIRARLIFFSERNADIAISHAADAFIIISFFFVRCLKVIKQNVGAFDCFCLFKQTFAILPRALES